VFLTDGGDNIMSLMAIYLAFTRCGLHWSLDARRARRRAGRGIGDLVWPDTPAGRVVAELDRTRREFVTFLHNSAVLVIMFQICVVYAAAGLYKSQGSYWRNGTALYYALHLDWFRPWPAVSNLVASQSVMIGIVAYLTVFIQVAFPLAVWSKWLKYPSLVLLLGMHLSIALVMGLPLFSAAMMIGDAVFLPDSLYLWAAAFVLRRLRAFWGRRQAAGGLAARLGGRFGGRLGGAAAGEVALAGAGAGTATIGDLDAFGDIGSPGDDAAEPALPEPRRDLGGGADDPGAGLGGVEGGEGHDADAGLQARDVADRSGEAMRPGL
jgi:hypothetical protein